MKKFVFALTLLTASASIPALGQGVVLKQDFEGAAFPPSGWSVIDNDGDGHCWQSCGDTYLASLPSGSTKQALSLTFERAIEKYYDAQDNWLVSPQVTIPNNVCVLQFTYAAQDINAAETFQVLISENGGASVSDFTKTLSTETARNSAAADDIEFQTYSKPLSDYSGKTIRFAIRHYGSGSYGLSVDNVFIYNQDGPLAPEPTRQEVGSKGALEATLYWTNASKTANGKNLSADDLKVNVYRDDVKVATLTKADGITPGGTSQWTDRSMSNGQHYYRLTSETSEGESPYSTKRYNVVVGYDKPSVPRNPATALTAGNVIVGWENVTSGASGGYVDPLTITYNVYRDGAQAATGITATTWTDTNVAEGTHTYEVTAVSEGGESAKGTATTTTVFAPNLADEAVAPTTTISYALTRLPDLYTAYSVFQTLYTPQDLNYVEGNITKLVFKSSSGTGRDGMPATIYITPTTLTSLTAWCPISATDKVYDGTCSIAVGVNDVVFDLDTPYNYEGGNFVITYVKNGNPQGSYADRFLSADLGVSGKSYTASTYSAIDINALPTSSAQSISEVPFTRFIIKSNGMAAISGTVVNKTSGEAVAGASVAVTGYPELTTATDAQGKFEFNFVPVAAASLTISATGYQTATVDLSLVADETAVLNVQLTENANYTLRGSVTTDDTRAAAAGAKVSLTGFSEGSATVGADGSFAISRVYSGEDYTLTITFPSYDSYTTTVNNTSDTEVTLPAVVLDRSLITPFGLEATIAADGSKASMQWKTPTDRNVETGVKSMGDVSKFNYTSGDYYATDFNIGHYFSVDNMAALKMNGSFVDEISVYIKKQPGTFTAKVWQGNRTNHIEVGAQVIPDAALSTEGSWVTVKFDEPVELRQGHDYIIGVNANLNELSTDVFGTAEGNYISGSNNIKWADYVYCENSYSAYCLTAKVIVPGTDGDINSDVVPPTCQYNVYRKESADQNWTKLTSTPLSTLEFTDNGWQTIPEGMYRYAVSAVYAKGESAKAPTLVIERKPDTDAGVVAFVSPVKSPELVDKATVVVTIANYGELPLSNIPVKVTLDGGTPLTTTHAGRLLKGETADVTVGEVALSEGIHNFEAYTAIAGDAIAANDTCTLLLPNLANIELNAYRWSAYGNAGFMQLHSNNPEGATFLAEMTPNDALITAAEHVNGTIYAFTSTWYGQPKGLVSIDPKTWTVTNAFTNFDEEYDYVIDMTYDALTGTMFALRPNDEYVDLVKVDTEEGVTAYVGSMNKVVRTLAADLEGKLYAIDQSATLFSVDPETAELTEIGATDAPEAFYLQTMAFDHNSGRLFWAATNNISDGDIYEVDPATGESRYLGTTLFEGLDACELVGLYSDYEYDDPSADGISSAVTSTLHITADADGNVTVETPADATVTVYNMQGAAVGTAAVEAPRSTVRFNLSPGIYVVKADTGAVSATIKAAIR